MNKKISAFSDPNVAIAGGFVEAIVHPNIPDRQRNSGIMGLAFCGAAIKASSVVIPHEVTDPEDVERIICEVTFVSKTWYVVSSIIQLILISQIRTILRKFSLFLF